MKSIYLNTKAAGYTPKLLLLTGLILVSSCSKFVDVASPVTKADAAAAYSSDAGAISVMTGIFSRAAVPLQGNFCTLSMCTGLSADELTFYGVGADQFAQLYANAVKSNTFNFFWADMYSFIYAANDVIQNAAAAPALTETVRNRVIGEAKFTRAFFYFYLVNLYGDVPLVTTTDYRDNLLRSREPAANVYKQIIADLKDAQNMMGTDYTAADLKTVSTDRVRPNKWVATALLARAYLFTGDYANAIAESTKVINQSTLFSLETLDNAFLKTSKESIWQLTSTINNLNTYEGNSFILVTAPNTSTPVSLSDYVYNAFENGDNRKISWVGTLTTTGTGAKTYHFPYKYQVRSTSTATIPLTENAIMFRLPEQYLIRAEAYIQTNNVALGVADLNTIRNRARAAVTAAVPNPLPTLSTGLTVSDALKAVEHERQVELFTEMGDRWLTLKRTKGFTNIAISRADEVMPAVTLTKGGTWSTNWQRYPIPVTEIQNDPNLLQNPGYN